MTYNQVIDDLQASIEELKRLSTRSTEPSSAIGGEAHEVFIAPYETLMTCLLEAPRYLAYFVSKGGLGTSCAKDFALIARLLVSDKWLYEFPRWVKENSLGEGLLTVAEISFLDEVSAWYSKDRGVPPFEFFNTSLASEGHIDSRNLAALSGDDSACNYVGVVFPPVFGLTTIKKATIKGIVVDIPRKR